MRRKKSLGRRLFDLIPPYNRGLYEFCSRYVDRFNGDNDSTPETNGEYLFLRRTLPALGAGVVFDVGANVGDWAAAALKINSIVNLHCFEPSRATYDALMQKRWPSTAQLNNLGVGEVEGVLTLHVIGEKSALNSFYRRRGVAKAIATKTEKVDVTTIDAYCERKGIPEIDYIKIDVEGHELSVLKGMGQMLSKHCVRIVQFEYGGCNLDSGASLGDIWSFLEPHGFRFFKLHRHGPRRVEKYESSLDTFKYSNWIAVHEACHLT